MMSWVCVRVCVLLESVVFVFQQWYTATMNLLGTWLTERMDQQLHVYQLKILIRITKVPPESSKHLSGLMYFLCVYASHADLLSSCRKSTGTFACRVYSTPPWTVRCTTQCAIGWLWRRPLLQWGKEACRASPWRTAMRRMKRMTRACALTLQTPSLFLNPSPWPLSHFWL